MNEFLHPSEYTMTFRDVLPIRSFTDAVLPAQNGIDDYLKVYERLSAMSIIPIKISSQTSPEIVYAGIGVPVRGLDISKLSLFGAPSKLFGPDSIDFVQDALAILNPQTNEEIERARNHEKITNWDKFLRISKRVIRAVELDLENPARVNLHLTPIIQLSKKNGILGFDLNLHPAILDHVTAYRWDSNVANADIYVSELGPLLIGAYSPEVTSTWPMFDTYAPQCGRRQLMAASQFIAYSLSRSDELAQHSRFAANFVHYCETGKLLPQPEIIENQSIPPFPEEPYFDENSADLIW